jgi:hypothetical protein
LHQRGYFISKQANAAGLGKDHVGNADGIEIETIIQKGLKNKQVSLPLRESWRFHIIYFRTPFPLGQDRRIEKGCNSSQGHVWRQSGIKISINVFSRQTRT